MQKKEIEELFERYRSGTCSDQEREIVERWYSNWNPDVSDLSEHELRLDLEEIRERLPLTRRRTAYIYKISAAAVLLLTVGLAFYFYNYNRPFKPEAHGIAQNNLILPGRNQALLTLANGKTIVLDTAGTGKIIEESGISITKTSGGELIYEVQDIKQGNELSYNTISTPRGGQYQVLLPDGTRVWLNAASNLRFPVGFTGKDRHVELNGEAYFEVARDAAKPFKVKTSHQQVEVLGTHFNINAYSDEDFTKTTLLEGRVSINKGREQVYLTPGQQTLNVAGQALKVRKVKDVTEAVAWKNGLFMFEQESIFTIMNKISRWYNIEVIYKGDLRGQRYSGNISKFEDVTEVLKTMALTGTIQFKIEGRRIIVMP